MSKKNKKKSAKPYTYIGFNCDEDKEVCALHSVLPYPNCHSIMMIDDMWLHSICDRAVFGFLQK